MRMTSSVLVFTVVLLLLLVVLLSLLHPFVDNVHVVKGFTIPSIPSSTYRGGGERFVVKDGVSRLDAIAGSGGGGGGLFMPSSSSSSPSSNNAGTFDRFVAVCPASREQIQLFDPAIATKENTNNNKDKDEIWVAVFRSNNNQPLIRLDVRDDFFAAMNEATSASSAAATSSTVTTSGSGNMPMMIETSSTRSNSSSNDTEGDGEAVVDDNNPQQRPVAIGRLSKSPTEDSWLLDSLRCTLKKESMDESCDGGSEFLESIGVAVDELLLWYLQEQQQTTHEPQPTQPSPVFHKKLRCKSTIYTHPVLEQRGFEEITTLSRDMATHISHYDQSVMAYQNRMVTNNNDDGSSSNGGVINHRALQICTLLGQLNGKEERDSISDDNEGDNVNDGDNGYDPWANINLRR